MLANEVLSQMGVCEFTALDMGTLNLAASILTLLADTPLATSTTQATNSLRKPVRRPLIGLW